jgi:hypothetical protein
MPASPAFQSRNRKSPLDRALDGSGARRLGSRTPTHFAVFIKNGGQRLRCRAAQLSTTGVVLDLRFLEEIDTKRLLQIDLAIPGHTRPIHAVVRPVRAVGRLQAYEFVFIKSVDQLTLAEFLDRLNRPGWA